MSTPVARHRTPLDRLFASARLLLLPVLFIAALTVAPPLCAESLRESMAELKNRPDDNTLRLKIIKQAQAMKPAPAISEEARQHFVEGNALLRKAMKEQRGYELAADAYRQCLLIAPWWGEAYNNRAIALEFAEKYDEAKEALKLYLATHPGEEETRKAQDKIYELGALSRFAAQQKSPPAAAAPPPTVAAPAPNPFEQLLKKIEGARYTYPAGNGVITVIDIRSGVIVMGMIDQGQYSEWTGEAGRVAITGPETTVPLYVHHDWQTVWATSDSFRISPDGERITMLTRFSDGDSREYIYFRQR